MPCVFFIRNRRLATLLNEDALHYVEKDPEKHCSAALKVDAIQDLQFLQALVSLCWPSSPDW